MFFSSSRMRVRRFHAASAAFFKQKNTGQKKIGTPSKAAGEYRPFRYAAAYSKHHQRAPTVPVDSPDLALVTAERLEELPVGRVATFPDAVQASLTHLGAYRPQQRNELFSTHAHLVRPETVKIGDKLREPGSQWRALLAGASGIGKSTLLSQAIALAKLRGWAVIHLTQSMSLLDGSTDAQPMKDGGKLWSQPMFMRRWARKVVKANRDILSPDVLKTLSTGQCSAVDLVKTISQQKPTLVTFDDVNAFAVKPFAENVDRDNNPIYHGHLEVPRVLLDLLNGSFNLANGGAVLASTTGVFQNPLDRVENAHPYATIEEYDHELAASLAAADRIEVSRFTPTETAAYVSYLKAAGIAQDTVAKEEVHAISGNGNPRNILSQFVNFSF